MGELECSIRPLATNGGRHFAAGRDGIGYEEVRNLQLVEV